MIEQSKHSDSRNTIRIAADVGGTFTDIVAFDTVRGVYSTLKVPTTPQDLSKGVILGMMGLVRDFGDLSFAVVGTTAGLNTFLERRGEPTMLIATEGVGDSYLIARGSRNNLYDIHYRRPKPIVDSDGIVEIGGRLDYSGKELRPLDENSVRKAAAKFKRDGFGAIAVCLLFSYVNPKHELRAEEILKEELGDVSVTLSHRVAREWREYERTSTTIVESYVAPSVVRDLNRLEHGAVERGLKPELNIMQSSGGLLTATAAKRSPIQTLLSGPTGAAVGGVTLAKALDRKNLILVDMGGTSFDVTLVVDGQVDVVSDTILEGHPLLMPVVNIHTVGAGGGSVAYLDEGALRVGPRSAGALPGPACYGRGGKEPTVTDANAFLGRLVPTGFAGGTMHLDLDEARASLESIAAPLGITCQALAEGILKIANARMAQAIRTITVEKGVEPRDFALVAIGGAGPMHAAFLAQELGIKLVLVPEMSGVFSAWGMLQSEMRHNLVAPLYRTPKTLDLDEIRTEFDRLISEGTAALANDGVSSDDMRFDCLADMRYVGQEYTIPIPWTSSMATIADLATSFNAAHERRRGVASPSSSVELISIRVTARGVIEVPGLKPVTGGQDVEDVRLSNAIFDGSEHRVKIVGRAQLIVQEIVRGPVIIQESTTTVVVPPFASASLAASGVLEIQVEHHE